MTVILELCLNMVSEQENTVRNKFSMRNIRKVVLLIVFCAKYIYIYILQNGTGGHLGFMHWQYRKVTLL